MFKKDNKQDIKNYRPITVLTVIGKVFEQLLSKQLTSFIDPMLCNNLTAYRKDQNCETSLIGLVERWKQAVDNRNVVGVLSTAGEVQNFFYEGVHSSLVYFNTNKPHSFFCRIPVALENRRSSQGGVRTPCTLPLDPPLHWHVKGIWFAVPPPPTDQQTESIRFL